VTNAATPETTILKGLELKGDLTINEKKISHAYRKRASIGVEGF